MIGSYIIKDIGLLAVELGANLNPREINACAKITGIKPANVKIFWEIFAVRHLAHASKLSQNDIEGVCYIHDPLYREVIGKTLAVTFDQYPFTPREKMFLRNMAARHVLPVLAGLISSELKRNIQQDRNLSSWMLID